MALQKFPIQIRLDIDELEALDQYVASFTDFPPSRVQVVHRALREWLAEKTAALSAGPAVPTAIETAGRMLAPDMPQVAPTFLPAESAPPLSEHADLPPEVREELAPAAEAEDALRPIVTSDEDALPTPPSPTKRSNTVKPLASRKDAVPKRRKGVQ
jgi:hypothetical protein